MLYILLGSQQLRSAGSEPCGGPVCTEAVRQLGSAGQGGPGCGRRRGHSVLLTETGEVFVCGQNHKGQLGLGHNTDVLTLQLCPVLNHKVTNVACGWDFTLLLTDSGRLLACGSNAFGQLGVGQTAKHTAELLAVEALKEPVVSVAAGLRHSLTVGASGSVYQWGTGLFSHAKRALSPHPVPSHLKSQVPCLVPGLGQRKSHFVSAGSAHCVCLTEEGELFLWGSSKHGQLATAEPFLPSPSLLNRSLLKGEKVMNVCSGWTHVVAQTESGRVFTWGRADYGQLGRPASVSEDAEKLCPGPVVQGIRKDCLPGEVTSLDGATQIACGSEHNLAVVGGASCRGAGTSMGCVATVRRLTSFILGSFLISDLFSLAVVLDIQWQCVV